MPNVTFITSAGQEFQCPVDEGESLLDVALNSMIPGIDGDCGGNVACGTCHVYVDKKWFGKIGAPVNAAEMEMLGNAEHVQENSRLACQISVTSDLDGLIVIVPSGQH